MANTNSTATVKVSRKTIMSAMLDAEVEALILATIQANDAEVTQEVLHDALIKWQGALNKGNKSTVGTNDAFIESDVVPFVLSAGEPSR